MSQHADADAERQAMEKYKELYDLSLESLRLETERNRWIDEKSTRHFSILTILLGAAGFFGQWMCDKLLPPKTCLEFYLVLCGIFFVIGLIVAWICLFMVVRLRTLQVSPMNQTMLAFWKVNRLLDIYNAMAKANGEAVQKNIATTERKTKWLNAGYWSIFVGLAFFVAFSSLFVVYAWTTHQR